MNDAVRPGDARWIELVESGRTAVARVDETKTERNWRLGDAALEIAPVGADPSHNGAYAALETYAGEVGVSFESLRQYRRASEMWTPGTRVPGAGWKVHQILADPTRRHLVVSGMTVTQAHTAAGQSTAGRTGPRADAADRARAAADALADPAVREEYERIAADRPEPAPYEPSHAARDALARGATERAEREATDPGPSTYRDYVSELGISSMHQRAALRIRTAHEDTWTPQQRQDAAELLEQHRRETESVDIDAEWRKINNG